MGVLRLYLLWLWLLLCALWLLWLWRPLTMHPAILVTRLGTVPTCCPLTRHTLAGNFGNLRGSRTVDTLQLLNLPTKLLKNGENLRVILHFYLFFGG